MRLKFLPVTAKPQITQGQLPMGVLPTPKLTMETQILRDEEMKALLSPPPESQPPPQFVLFFLFIELAGLDFSLGFI